MRSLPRLLACALAAVLLLLAGLFTACAITDRVDGLTAALANLFSESFRNDDLSSQTAGVLQRIDAKRAVTRDLFADRIGCREAVAAFCQIGWKHTLLLAGRTDQEKAANNLRSWIRVEASRHGSFGEERRRQIEQELKELLAEEFTGNEEPLSAVQ